jgi:site-specific DNA-cytosine methylase
MHALPRLAAINWLRLALIPAGRDWRALPESVSLPARPGRQNGGFGVNLDTAPGHAVLANAGDVRNTWSSVTDPRLQHDARRGTMEVQHERAVARTVIAETGTEKPGRNVADPRLRKRGTRHAGIYGVQLHDAPAHTVIREARTGKAWSDVADPRSGFSPTHSIVTDARLDASVDAWTRARFELRGPTMEVNSRRPLHLIVRAPDGTFHRPLTTLELAVLQGLPAWHCPADPTQLDLYSPAGTWLVLPGTQADQRALIGNAIPPPAAQAIGVEILEALDAVYTSTIRLLAGGTWVSPSHASVAA